jgi:23S rRNA (guanosine2251-2'-O)-methyltransferase
MLKKNNRDKDSKPAGKRSAPAQKSDRKEKPKSDRFDRKEKPFAKEETRIPRRGSHAKTAEAPRSRTEAPESTFARKPEKFDRAQRPRDDKKRTPAPLLVWGRRPVDSLLAELVEKSKTGLKHGYLLHLLGDEKGKVPAQLRDTVEQAKGIGLKVKVALGHTDETWPLSGDENFNHQRVCLQVPEFPVASVYDVLALVKEKIAAGARGCLGVVLDQVQDPRNFGSILRSASFFQSEFAIFGEDRQAPISSTVLKASAGGAFSLKLASVVNINRALAQLKEAGVWIVGSALTDTAVTPEKVPTDRAYVLVVGNEGKGMRQDVARNCDYVVKIPGGNAMVDSLNVGVAAGLLLGRLNQH